MLCQRFKFWIDIGSIFGYFEKSLEIYSHSIEMTDNILFLLLKPTLLFCVLMIINGWVR